MVAMLATVMLVLLAFVTDIGMAFVNKDALQGGADAAALAVAQEIALTAPANQTCSQLDASMSTSMRVVAEKYFAEKSRTGGAIEPGTAGFDLVCTASGLVVKVSAAQNSAVFFSGVIGVSNIPVKGKASTIVAPAGSVSRPRPFAICQVDANKLKLAAGVNYAVSFGNDDSGCGSTGGAFGVMDFNGGANGQAEVQDWIQNGYDGSVSASPPVTIPGNPGAPSPGAYDNEMNSILGSTITLPVYDQITGSGNNTVYRISGFITVQICGWKFNNKQNPAGGCSTPVPAPVPSDYLQLKYVHFIPIGDLNTACMLGTSTCDNGVRLFQLAE